ncbi:MAG: hypothetical protein JJE48_09385 [Actinobacteria bacterium]|nr:hypothetical protein [Actinomycetota bacterium]
MNRRVFPAIAVVALISLLVISCLALTGCGQKEKQETSKKEVTHEEEDIETSATEKATTATEETETEPEKDETDVVVKVAVDSARGNNPDLPELRVVETKIINDEWARVVLEPVDRSTDAATWFMKKESGKWTVFDFGTAIMPENHPEAPPELFE